MGCGGSFGSSRRARYENACTPLYDFNSCYDSSRHIEARHWLAQPSDNKICVSGNCFPSGGENNKIGGGVRGFSLSVSQGLSGKHNCFVGASLEPISRPTHALALRSAGGVLGNFSGKSWQIDICNKYRVLYVRRIR